jgi:hypothetical protein
MYRRINLISNNSHSNGGRVTLLLSIFFLSGMSRSVYPFRWWMMVMAIGLYLCGLYFTILYILSIYSHCIILENNLPNCVLSAELRLVSLFSISLVYLTSHPMRFFLLFGKLFRSAKEKTTTATIMWYTVSYCGADNRIKGGSIQRVSAALVAAL